MITEEQVEHEGRTRPVVFRNLRRCAVKGRGMVGWCYRMCEPEGELGLCGYPAAHAAHSATGLILRELRRRELEEAAAKNE